MSKKDKHDKRDRRDKRNRQDELEKLMMQRTRELHLFTDDSLDGVMCSVLAHLYSVGRYDLMAVRYAGIHPKPCLPKFPQYCPKPPLPLKVAPGDTNKTVIYASTFARPENAIRLAMQKAGATLIEVNPDKNAFLAGQLHFQLTGLSTISPDDRWDPVNYRVVEFLLHEVENVVRGTPTENGRDLDALAKCLFPNDCETLLTSYILKYPNEPLIIEQQDYYPFVLRKKSGL